MAASKKPIFVDIELEWAEKQLQEWKAYIDANPLHTLRDRIEWKPTSRGGSIPMVIASIEQQGKFVQDTLKNYLALLKEVDAMREAETKKIEARGQAGVSSHAEEWLKNKL